MRNYSAINIVINIWCCVIVLTCGILMNNFETLYSACKISAIIFLTILCLSNSFNMYKLLSNHIGKAKEALSSTK